MNTVKSLGRHTATSTQSVKRRYFLTTALGALAAMSVHAATYQLRSLGSSSSPLVFSDPSNWTVDGEPAATYPQQGDTILFGTGNSQYFAHFELDSDYTIASIAQSFNCPCLYKSTSTDADVVSLTFTGVVGGNGYQYYYANGGTKLVFASSSTLKCAKADWNESRGYATQTGEIDVLGTVDSRHMNWYVSDSAKLYFAPTSYTQDNNTSRIDDNFSISGGSIIFANGLEVLGGNSSHNNKISQSGGIVSFGGDFKSVNSPWVYTFSGGTLSATAGCTFDGNVSLVIPESAEVSIDVAQGATLSIASFSASPYATITKTGAGTFSFAPTEATIVVNEGSIGLGTAGAYDLTNVSLGEGADATIALTAFGARVDALPEAMASVSFCADLSSASVGTVVFYSANASILAKVANDLSGSVPAGFQLAANGEALSIEVVSDFVFNASGDLLKDDDNWTSGTLPASGAEVSIAGEGVVAEFSGGDIPAWTSIEIKNGATLRIIADADLPPILLNKRATLEIVSGSTFMTNGITGTVIADANNITIPSLVVGSSATLNVPGGMKFKNVDMTLNGTLTRTSSGSLYFGYAESGEVTYFGLHANAAKITDFKRSSYDTSIQICCPALGGEVHAVGQIEFKDMPTSGAHLPSSGDNYWNGLALGDNNPANIPFEVVFDNTAWTPNGISKITGGAALRLKNGSRFANSEHDNLYGRRFDIQKAGKVIVEDGSELCINSMGDWGSVVANIQADTASGQAVIAEEGAVVEFYSTAGNGNAVMTFSNATFRICRPNIYYDNNGKIYANVCQPFKGLRSVSLAKNSTLTFSTRNGFYFKDDSGPRVVTLADVPITGEGGSITLSNANINEFGVVVKNGRNTATGTADVINPQEGKGATTLYFADGANWAGTVVAGNVGLAGESAAAVSFGRLDLSADFPVRVWKDGSTLSGDKVDVGEYVNNGGKLVPTMASEGAAFGLGDTFDLGKIKKTSPLPRMPVSWLAKRVPLDDEYDMLQLKVGLGMQVILR